MEGGEGGRGGEGKNTYIHTYMVEYIEIQNISLKSLFYLFCISEMFVLCVSDDLGSIVLFCLCGQREGRGEEQRRKGRREEKDRS